MPEPTSPDDATDATDDADEAGDCGPNAFDRTLDRVDALQRRFGPVAFVFALVKRFGEDRGSQYAALLAYYGFFSVLPILLVVTTVLAWALGGDPARQQQLINSIASRIPVAGDAIASNVHSMSGSGVALGVGLLFLFYGALGVVNAAQDAFNTMWGLPRFTWPNFAIRIVRSVAVMAVVGTALLASALGATLLTSLDSPGATRVLTDAAAIAINTAALLVTFELLVNRRIGFRTLLPGSIVGGFALFVTQVLGTWYMTTVINRASSLYGAFALAFGLLIWIALVSRVVLLAGEVNVVWSKRLWPRSLTGRNLGDADRRALEDAVERESMSHELVVSAIVESSGGTVGGGSAGALAGSVGGAGGNGRRGPADATDTSVPIAEPRHEPTR